MSNSLPTPDLQSSTLVQDQALVAPAASASSSDEQFLRMHLVDNTVLLPVTHLTEVLTVPIDRIVPISHMPAWVMGVHNWRGEVLWMIDLGHLCGLTPWYEQIAVSAHSAVVLQIRAQTTSSPKSQTLGLVVSQIGEMEWCDSSVIQPLPTSTMSPEIAPFLRGYWWNSDNEMLAVLDGAAILEAMPKL